MAATFPDNQTWLDQVDEAVVDPERPIVDPHHHFWHNRRVGEYLLKDLRLDTDSGHRIEKTVFLECGAEYRSSGAKHLAVVGESEFVAGIAAESRESSGAEVAAIVGSCDLRATAVLDEVLAAHQEASRGLFRGIRHSGARDDNKGVLMIPGQAPEGLYSDDSFRSGVKRLGEQGFSYDTWHYHHQNADFYTLACAVPDTVMVLDHFGTPLGVGPYAEQRESIFKQWKIDVARIAECPNVHAKLGGLAMPDNGFGWHLADRPPTSDEFIELQHPYYQHMIDCFGPERCMFESNFPVDRFSVSYKVLWNAFKKMTAGYSEDEKHALFYGTAVRVYRLDN